MAAGIHAGVGCWNSQGGDPPSSNAESHQLWQPQKKNEVPRKRYDYMLPKKDVVRIKVLDQAETTTI